MSLGTIHPLYTSRPGGKPGKGEGWIKKCRDGNATKVFLQICCRACRSPSPRETEDRLKDGGREVDLKELMVHKGE